PCPPVASTAAFPGWRACRINCLDRESMEGSIMVKMPLSAYGGASQASFHRVHGCCREGILHSAARYLGAYFLPCQELRLFNSSSIAFSTSHFFRLHRGPINRSGGPSPVTR